MRRDGQWCRALVLAGTLLSGPAQAEVGPHTLNDVSDSLLRAYNRSDAVALHELLAPALQAKYAIEDLRLTLARCRGLTHDIDRFSIPSWGARNFGFFGVYAENSVLEMILEIDPSGKIVHMVITDDLAAKDQQCTLTRF
ncbi:hypothetical protein [Microvirga arsenatis]|uniref:DUF3887 domain-containing protein n=1 Tax=Microvirga arsenatis TaxID=2692265 RepID=A0ABW9Z2M1_9HYPH|nr:hypothetical protein [Microvirga arsenatis]NBJ12049.1 hypothetical protein [Microvirga arsenatis]NBJ25960.1 hypothetical protein [Microvirga arsenatis]